MVWLNAALAFAVAMIVFSSIASAATESIQRIFHLRERGLRTMLGRLFDRVMRDELGVAPEKREELVASLVENRAVDKNPRMRSFGYWFAPRRLASLSLPEFLQRVAESDVGRDIATAGAAEMDRAATRLAQQFERVGADARAYFHERAKALSITVSVILAFALNVDAVRLFTTLVSDPELAVRLIEAQEAQMPETSEPGVSDASAPSGTDAADKDLEELQRTAALVRQHAAEAASMGLPIGVGYFPWCRDGGVGVGCDAIRSVRHEAPGVPVVDTLRTIIELPAMWFTWLLTTFATGLLIGLGGPFWFDAFSRLSSMVQLVKSLGGKARDEKGADQQGSGQLTVAGTTTTAVVAESASPRSPVEVFRATAPPPARYRGRVRLSAEGKRI